jgi:hypothetical protein
VDSAITMAEASVGLAALQLVRAVALSLCRIAQTACC